MKRLISLIIVVFTVSLASQSIFAANGDERRDERKVQQEDGGLFHFEPYLKNYLPLDLELIGNDSVGATCNEKGLLEERLGNKGKFRCMEYLSPSSKEHYRIQHPTKDEGLRVFTFRHKKPVLYASFTPNPETWRGDQVNRYSKVTYQSSEAQQYAQAHGGANDTEVVVAKPVPTQTKPAEQTATVDCSKGTLFEKMQCLGKNPAIGAVINKLPSF